MLPLGDEEAASLLEALPRSERFAAWRLAEPDEGLLCRGAAAIALLGHLGAPGLAALARRAEPLLDRAYDFVARRRHLLGRVVPDGAAPRRFP